jgi:very-short-patch-repair endonuclease
MSSEPANHDGLLARMAGTQHGVITRAQLAQVGIRGSAVSYRVKIGRLHRLHRGVYAVGHTRLSFEGRCLAAVLACSTSRARSGVPGAASDGQPPAVLSHGSAAALWGMTPAPSGPIDVTVPGDAGREMRAGIRIHRSVTLSEKVRTSRLRIPVTRPARTLRDLRRVVPPGVHQRAVRRAVDLRLIREEDLGATSDLTRSELERMFLRLCRRRRLPIPEVNVRIAGYEVDFLWRDSFLIAETDGFRHHRSRAAFEADRARDAHLQSLGFRVLRFTHRQVRESPERVARSLRGLLGSGQLRLG